MTKLVIFGTGAIAEVAHYYFSSDSSYAVSAFTVDGPFVSGDSFCGKPVVPFEEVQRAFPPDDYWLFVAVSYQNLNRLREQKVREASERRYQLASYISSKATVLSSQIGSRNCFILEDNTIQPFVRIENNVTLWSGNHIGHHSRIHDNCFISSHVVVSGGVSIGANSFVGVNATIRDNVSIGDHCVIGAAAVILSDTEPGGVYMAEPTERSRVPSHRLRRI